MYRIVESRTFKGSKELHLSAYNLPKHRVMDNEAKPTGVLAGKRVSMTLPYYVHPAGKDRKPFLDRLCVMLILRAQGGRGAGSYGLIGGTRMEDDTMEGTGVERDWREIDSSPEDCAIRELAEETGGMLFMDLSDNAEAHTGESDITFFKPRQLIRVEVPYINPYTNIKHPGRIDLHFLELGRMQYHNLNRVSKLFDDPEFFEAFKKNSPETEKFIFVPMSKALQSSFYTVQTFRDLRLLAKFAAHQEGIRGNDGKSVLRNKDMHRVSPVLSKFRRSEFLDVQADAFEGKGKKDEIGNMHMLMEKLGRPVTV